ncbi:hypothetical protein ACFL35_13310 [Candidatus Riflebacteria bacterium]
MSGQIFSATTGFLLIATYGLLAFFLTWYFSPGKVKGKVQFLLANRELGVWEAAFSIAATWIWAPALFLAAEKAYTQGFVGVFWFTVPNVLCLILFAFFATRIRHLVPEGFTLSHYMYKRYSRRVQALYLVQLVGLALCSFAVQLLAGGKVLSHLTNLPFFSITFLLAILALSYSLVSGLKASVLTDYAQMAIILSVTILIVPWAVFSAGGPGVLWDGFGGSTGDYGNLFSRNGLSVAYSFGIPVTIGLLAGPFGDQSFWQRAFAIKEEQITRAFFRGALLFAIVPVFLSMLGFIAAGKGWVVKDPALVNLEVIARVLPGWVMLPFLLMLLSGLVSTLDSNLCAISSISGHDLLQGDEKDYSEERIVKVARFSMPVLALGGILIANLPGIKILHLFLFYGTLRAATFLPTVITLLFEGVSEEGIFLGILCAIIIGLPLFAYGNFYAHTAYKVAGSILTVSIAALFVLIYSKYKW